MDTLAQTAPPEESVSWSFTPLAVFGAATIVLVYAANFAFWWITVPRLVRLGMNNPRITPLPDPVQVLSDWSNFVHLNVLLLVPMLAGLVVLHTYAMFDRSNLERRTFAWLLLMLLGVALIAQFSIAVLSMLSSFHPSSAIHHH